MTTRLVLIIDSALEHTRLLGAAVRRVGETAGLNDAGAFDLELAVLEAVTNCILHGYAGAAGHEVRVTIDVHPDALEVEILDHGAPIPPERLHEAEPEIDPEERDLPEGGLGVFLIRSLMHEVRYESSASGNRMRLRRRLAA